jgi:hypothetical protein
VDRVLPDGIDEAHFRTGSPFPRRSRWTMLFVLGAFILSAFTGVFGGGRQSKVLVTGAEATLRMEAPATVRNGETLELRFALEAWRPIARPVIAMPEPYWRDVTVTTMMPLPTNETFREGQFLFEFDPLEAGQVLHFKVDAKINPSRFGASGGLVSVRDAERTLAQAPVRMRVLP